MGVFFIYFVEGASVIYKFRALFLIMKEAYNARINYNGKLEDISNRICKDFGIGEFVSNELVLTGYEDYNFVLETTENKYFVKIFSNFRSIKDCERYVNIMSNVVKTKINTPKLIKSDSGYLNTTKVNNTPLRYCVMDYVNGKDLFNSNKTLDKSEIKFIAQQAALINSVNIKPSFIYDSWAISNFKKEFEEKGKYLSSNDVRTVQPLLRDFDDLKIDDLPHCFVHGDIISTNVIKDDNDELWIVDFSVSNHYPRIQELAVLGCDLLFDKKNKAKSEKNFNIALLEYQKRVPLTDKEINALPTYIKLAHAMHVLRANYERVVGNNTSVENESFLELGRYGLKQMSE